MTSAVPTRVRPALSLLAVLLAWLAPSRAAGQESGGLVLRVVAAEDWTPVPAAVVRVDGAVRGATGMDGRLVLERLSPGRHQLEVSALGRRPLAPQVEVPAGARPDLEVALEAAPLELPPLEVRGGPTAERRREVERIRRHASALAEFYERAGRSEDGWFVMRAQLEGVPLGRFTDLFHVAPDASVEAAEGGPVVRLHPEYLPSRPKQPTSLFSSEPQLPGCEPDYYLDGRRYPVIGSPDHFRLAEIEGIEVYVGPTVPPRFGGARARCGVIAIWRRI